MAPPWMEVEALEETLASERSSEAEFQPLPFHYLELSTALFKHAPDAFGESTARVMDLIENIRRRVHHPNLVELTFSLPRSLTPPARPAQCALQQNRARLEET